MEASAEASRAERVREVVPTRRSWLPRGPAPPLRAEVWPTRSPTSRATRGASSSLTSRCGRSLVARPSRSSCTRQPLRTRFGSGGARSTGCRPTWAAPWPPTARASGAPMGGSTCQHCLAPSLLSTRRPTASAPHAAARPSRPLSAPSTRARMPKFARRGRGRSSVGRGRRAASSGLTSPPSPLPTSSSC